MQMLPCRGPPWWFPSPSWRLFEHPQPRQRAQPPPDKGSTEMLSLELPTSLEKEHLEGEGEARGQHPAGMLQAWPLGMQERGCPGRGPCCRQGQKLQAAGKSCQKSALFPVPGRPAPCLHPSSPTTTQQQLRWFPPRLQTPMGWERHEQPVGVRRGAGL